MKPHSGNIERRFGHIFQLEKGHGVPSGCPKGAGAQSLSIQVTAMPAFRNQTSNPYNSLLYRSLQARGVQVEEFTARRRLSRGVDVLHVHWPEQVPRSSFTPVAALRAFVFLKRVTHLRASGAKLVWTVHNARPHEPARPWLWGLYWRRFLRQLDGVIFLTNSSRKDAVAAMPILAQLPHAVIWHGHYRPVLALPARADARTRLGLSRNDFVLLQFGRIRRYKNVPQMLRAFIALARPNTFLVVAGKVNGDGDLEAEIRGLAAGHDGIRLELEHLPQVRLNDYLAAADLIVLPYRDILNSGGLLMALSAGRPVLCPDRGSIPEIATAVGPGWVRCFTHELGPAELAAAIDRETPPGEPDLSRCDWDAIAREHLEFYAQILGAQVRAGSKSAIGTAAGSQPNDDLPQPSSASCRPLCGG